MTNTEFFKFRRLYELKRGDIFRINMKGVFYSVVIKNENSMLIQTKYGKARNYQKTSNDLDVEVLYYPDMK